MIATTLDCNLWPAQAWETLTGYERDDVLGLNARLLQGVATEEAAITRCMQAVRNRSQVSVCISNYGKNGMRFRHNLSLHPLCNNDGAVQYMLSLSGDADATVDEAQDLGMMRKLISTDGYPSTDTLERTTLAMAMRVGKQADFGSLRNCIAYFTAILCIDDPYRWFRSATFRLYLVWNQIRPITPLPM